MSKVEKARAEMSGDIYRFFVEGMEPDRAEALIERFYRPIFDYRWNREEDYFGHVLLDRGRVAGFVGAFFVTRTVSGIQRRFCNLTTWKVREENRSESILLIMPFLRMKEYTVTGRTAARDVFAIHQKLGFHYLDDRVIIVPTFAGCRVDTAVLALRACNDLSGLLSEYELRLVNDHAPYKCHPLVLSKGGRSLLLIVTLAKKCGISVACLQHISDIGLLLEMLPLVKYEVSRRLKAPFLWIEKRLLRGAVIPFSMEYRSPFVHLYKSSELEPGDIDNLYTELAVYNTLENRFY